MKKKRSRYWLMAIGILLLGAGFVLLKFAAEPQGIMLALPYVCIGLGCGMFGHRLGDVVSQKAAHSNPQLLKEIEVEKSDERNIAISDRAKAKAFDIMLYVFGVLLVSFTLMGVELTVVLLFVFAYLFVVTFFIFHLNKYNKKL